MNLCSTWSMSRLIPSPAPQTDTNCAQTDAQIRHCPRFRGRAEGVDNGRGRLSRSGLAAGEVPSTAGNVETRVGDDRDREIASPDIWGKNAVVCDSGHS